MRTLLMVAVLVATSAPAVAQDKLADQLRKGIAEEETSQNLDKAIQAYQGIVARYDEDRKTAGTALFRLAECYRRAGKREQAVAAYQRVVREFPDQQAMAESSKRQLASLGVAPPKEVRPEVASTRVLREGTRVAREVEPVPARDRAKRVPSDSIEATNIEIEAARNHLRAEQDRFQETMKKYEGGTAAQADTEAAQVRLEDAQIELKQLEVRLKQQMDERDLVRRTMESVQKEMMLLQERIGRIETNIKKGLTSEQDTELLQLRRDLLNLQRRLDELKVGLKR